MTISVDSVEDDYCLLRRIDGNFMLVVTKVGMVGGLRSPMTVDVVGEFSSREEGLIYCDANGIEAELIG